MCKVGTQFVVLRLVPGNTYWADEDDTRTPPRSAVADSEGRAEFANIDFEKEYEGEPANIYVAEDEEFNNTVVTANIAVIQPCK